MRKKDFGYNDSSLERLRSPQNNLSNIIETTKQQYFAKIPKKLSDPNVSLKTYWSILEIFLKGKRFFYIPSIFHANKFIPDFREKTELLNSFFSNQCSLKTNSIIFCADYELFTDESLSNVTFTDINIGRIVRGLDTNKAHCYGMISTRMVKFCSDFICKPLGVFFRAFLEHEVFS